MTIFFNSRIPLSLGSVLDIHNMTPRCVFALVEHFEVKNHPQNKQKRTILDPEILEIYAIFGMKRHFPALDLVLRIVWP